MMNLERGDLLQMEAISCRGTLKLLPLGKKNKQKLLVGDDSGSLSCYEFKKGEPQVVFQVKLFDGPISCVALGGNPQKKDKIFVSHSQRIVGLSKKGKDFFKLTSSLTETIETIAVEDTRIWTGCEFVYNLYDNGKDTAYFICKDRINDLLVAHATRDGDFEAILACQDSCIRIIHGSTQFMEIPTTSPVTTLAFTEIDRELSSSKAPTALIYALETGVLALVEVRYNGEFEHVWNIDDGAERSEITCIKLYDVTKDKTNEIIVGRDDGRLEVYKLESVRSPPVKVFSKNLGETIRSVECGMVNSSDHCEIIVALYSGKIVSFTTEPVLGRALDDAYGRSIQTVNNENRIKHLKKELDGLKTRLDKERLRVSKANETASMVENQILPPSDFPINFKFLHDPDVAAYILTVELQSPIDLIMLRSPVVLDLIESDSGSSVLSVTPPSMSGVSGSNVDGGGKFVAVFRSQTQVKRISLTLRTNEGEFGDLIVTVVASTNPKAAKTIKFDLKPLSLHTRMHAISTEQSSRQMNKVKYSGTMQLPIIHDWIQAIFPDVPPRLDDGTNYVRYYFRNTFTGAVTTCEAGRNEITIESESASTIAIAKENITRLANYRRVILEESMQANELTIDSYLSLIRSKLEHQLSLARKIQLVDAVQEISMQENSLAWLSDDYKDILEDQERIRELYYHSRKSSHHFIDSREFKTRDKSLEYLSGIITDLYVDWSKLHGVDARMKIPLLQKVILSSSYEELIKAFHSNMSH